MQLAAQVDLSGQPLLQKFDDLCLSIFLQFDNPYILRVLCSLLCLFDYVCQVNCIKLCYFCCPQTWNKWTN